MRPEREEVVQALVATGKWGERDARLSERSRHHCTYCGRDLLGSVDEFKLWEKDHIVPQSAGGEDTEENITLCCLVCNRIKGKWDPRKQVGPDPSREELIEAAKKYLFAQRTKLLVEIMRYREIVMLARE